jgi:2-polyprenyl-6-methoxyphenol hydroxylase-like FAD-dependent oxidoreductase
MRPSIDFVNGDVLAATPTPILRGPTLILGPDGCFLFASTIDYEDVTAAGRHYYDRDQYVMWGFSTHDEAFAFAANSSAADGEDAMAAVLGLMDDWHPALRHLVQSTDLPSVTTFAVKSSVPIPPWATRNVTLPGDALHNMTPFRGIGANTALRDAAALRQTLVAVAGGQADLIPALAIYERNMVRYGFAAVQASLANMNRFHAKSRLARATTKSLLRVIDHVTPLKSAFIG